MLLCDTASVAADAIDTLSVFVWQARGCGVPMAIHRHSLPPNLSTSQLYDIAPLVTEVSPNGVDGLVVIGVEAISDNVLRRIRRLTGGVPVPTMAYGIFETPQQRVGATARLAYALGTEPEIRDVEELPGLPISSAPVFSCDFRAMRIRHPHKPRVAFILPNLEAPGVAGAVRTVAASHALDTAVITNGRNKSAWIEKLGGRAEVWHLGELTPRAFAARFDIALLCDKPMRWYRYQALLANLVGKGAALVDVTDDRHWAALPDGIIGGHLDGVTLVTWLQQELVPALDELSEAQAASKLRAFYRPPRELAERASDAGTYPPPRPARHRAEPDQAGGRIVFMPTNGVGLGHAKRCSQVARALQTPRRAIFAAFPSCLQMLNKAGLDAMPLISKTPHRAGNTNDLVNHSRLDTLCKEASGLVFDGGYVFESVLRSIADNSIPSVWIRRGLWQETQNNAVAIDRSKIFDRIIVPTEAFQELNHSAPTARNAVEIGPIVQQVPTGAEETEALRQAVYDRIGKDAPKLVVTMLGGGVAADRKAQINAICTHLAARPDVINLLVIWPTAVADPAWFAHPNTTVVQTHHASALVAAADLYVSAVGYNSFHEAMYGGIPTIFIPQMASFMDGQRARARAAAERGLSLLVEPWQTLRLTQAIDECLEGRAGDLRERLRGVNLPEPGNEAAARLIEETCA